jgi:DNA polymerase III alpha subunit
MKNPKPTIRYSLVDVMPKSVDELELSTYPKLLTYIQNNIETEQFDTLQQEFLFMPGEYKTLDIAKWLLDQCETDEQLQRVGHELLLYMERNLFTLLQYLKYLVDTMRSHDIVWGIGRGSSVSSYVLYLIGIHKIDSIYYDLDVAEFLR